MFKKRLSLTISEEKTIIDFKNKNPKLTLSDLQHIFKYKNKKEICKTTISKILKNKEFYRCLKNSSTKKIRSCKFENLEQKLFAWFCDPEKQKLILNEEIILCKARELKDKL